MSITGPDDLAGMRAAGAIVRRMLEAMKRAVRPGITTAELDAVGAAVMREHGAQSAPQLVYKFPGVNCISLNDEAVHGIPGEPHALSKLHFRYFIQRGFPRLIPRVREQSPDVIPTHRKVPDSQGGAVLQVGKHELYALVSRHEAGQPA